MYIRWTFSFLCCCLATCLFGQVGEVSVYGTIEDANSKKDLEGAFVTIQYTRQGTVTDALGNFKIAGLKTGEQVLVVEKEGYATLEIIVVVRENEDNNVGTIELYPVNQSISLEDQDIIPVITLSESDLTGEGVSNQNISGMLFASRDVFINTAAFNLGSARFRIRGYDSENTTVLLNGIPTNDLEDGRVYWSAWGGLNDVTRNQEISLGLGSSFASFGGVGGVTQIDTRASSQRKTLRFSYASSNRSYRNRLMATYNSGPLNGGWAVSLSGSRRWAEEGYAEGTFYDGWSYFASIDKLLGRKHLLNLTFLGAPVKRGKEGAAVQEIYDITDNNYYNSYWGYQNGKKRNSRIADIHEPIAILRYDWEINPSSKLTASASYQFGHNASTALDWFNARDPRPDYYQRLPSYARGRSADSLAILNVLTENPDLLQIDWQGIYNANRFSALETIEDANGTGEAITGQRANYILEERRFDAKRLSTNINFQTSLNRNLTLNLGTGYQYHKGENFKVVKDLLGADFYVDIDRFADDELGQQNNADIPNRLVYEGDRFGYDYDINIIKSFAWGQLLYSLPNLDVFIAGNIDFTQYWRVGNVRNGKFPTGNDSFGESEKLNFTSYGVKGGFTYKIDGRNYFYARGMYGTRAPYSRYAFSSPRTRNEVVDGLVTEKITSVEAGYDFRSPYFKAKLSGYYSLFEDGVDIQSFFVIDPLTDVGDFIYLTLNGIDKQHFGIEAAVEARIYRGLTANAVAAVGQYTYVSRPQAKVYVDSERFPRGDSRTIYMKNFYVPGTPQQAYSFGLKYSGKEFWFASLNFNYFDDIWIDFNPIRRTEAAVADIPRDSELFQSTIFQEKAPAGYTLDFFGGKSFKLADNYFLNLTVGVNNLLNNQEIITGGYEQGRFEFEPNGDNRFPNRYYYMYGLNYFFNATFRIQL